MYQQFPNGRRWLVDIDRAARVALGKERLTHEVAHMARAFPRWVLTTATERNVQLCPCKGVLIFDRGFRCVACDAVRPPQGQLAWFGLLPPVGIDSLTHIKQRLLDKPPPRHLVGHQAGLGSYLLVPLVAVYPVEAPARPVRVFYQTDLRYFPGMPSQETSHEFHMLPGGQMCLYASGEWSPATTCCEVLQQRAYAHVIKMLNYANGKRDAFRIVS